jgi:cytochrome c biogenesis protein CcmG/thiol:disulfide interchange protein DsbE
MASESPRVEDPSDDEDFNHHGPWGLRIVVGVAIVALGAYFLLQPSGEDGGTTQTLPAFDLPLLAGDGSFSSADMQGKPMVINFWASWCGPCREETPLLQRTWEKYENRGLVILGVNVQDTPDGARDFVKEFDMSYPVVVDEDQRLYDQLVEFEGLPQTFFVDETGRFLDRGEVEGGSLVLGSIDEAELEAQIQVLLEGS